MLVVDRATREELSEVLSLAVKTLPEVPAQWMASPESDEILVAKDLPDDRIVGFAVAGHADPCEGHLLALAVDAVHRGRGVGSALLRGMKTNLAASGCYRLRLEVRADDIDAQAFYARHGFTPEGLVESVYSDGEDAVRYAGPLG